MRPKYFRVIPWEWEPRANCDDSRFSANSRVPAEYRGVLPFRIGDGGRAWHDALFTGMGITLFSERVVKAFAEDGIVGMTFYEARISSVFNERLARKAMPKYFWGRPEGAMEFDEVAQMRDDRTVPINVTPQQGVDAFHFNYGDGRRGSAYSMRVLETFRKHKITNLRVTPLDYYVVDKTDFFTPPFRIKVLAKPWPPEHWYPDGFTPHPNNLVSD